MRYALDIEKKSYLVDLSDSFFNGTDKLIKIDGKPFRMALSRKHGVVILTNESGVERMLRLRSFVSERFDGDAQTKLSIEMIATAAEGMQKASMLLALDVPGQAQRAKQAAGSDLIIRSQITGKVLAVEVKIGATVEQGQTLAIVEAMKMENRIFAPVAGTLLSVSTKPGDSIKTGGEMFKIKREPVV